MPFENIIFDKGDNSITINVKTNIYPLDVIYSAAYVFLDKAYILLDGDPKKTVTVKMVPKEGQDIKMLGMEFNNELLGYSLYKKQSEKNSPIRQAIITRAIITGDASVQYETELSDSEELDADYLNDPEGIAVPWETKSKEESDENPEPQKCKDRTSPKKK